MLTCPSQKPNDGGFVIKANKGLDYDPGTNYPVLWTHPDWSDQGTILGTYPYIPIPANAKLVGEIGCLAGYPDCNVTFTLFYEVLGQSSKPYNSWVEVHDANATTFEIFLAGLKGELVSFQFYVKANDLAVGSKAAAFWLNTRIVDATTNR